MCVCVVGDLSLTSCDLHSFSHYFETGSLIEPGAHGIDPGICLHLLSHGKNCKCIPTVPRFLYVCWGSEPRSVWQAPFQMSNPPSTQTTSCILCFVSTKSTTQPTASKQQDTHISVLTHLCCAQWGSSVVLHTGPVSGVLVTTWFPVWRTHRRCFWLKTITPTPGLYGFLPCGGWVLE